MTNLDSVLKSRDITLPTKVHRVKAMVFPVIMYGCENWTIKKAECRRIDASELWCWRRLLRDPWTARRSNLSMLKEISPGCSLEGPMLKLKLQIFGHLMRRVESFEKTLMLGKIEGRRRRGWQRMRWLDGITDSMDMLLLLLLSCFSHVWLCATPQMAAQQAPLPLGFSRQEYWSGLPFPSPMPVCMLSCFSCVQLCAIPWTAAHEAPLSTEFSKQEYWSGLPFPSPQWTWVWVNSGSWWWTGGPGVLWFMGSQRVGHAWATELNWTHC